MITVKCTYENKDTVTTDINRTLEEAKEYFLLNYFNLGQIIAGDAHDNMQKCIKVEEVK